MVTWKYGVAGALLAASASAQLHFDAARQDSAYFERASAADVNGDGREDLIGFTTDAIWVQLAVGDGRVGEMQPVAIEGTVRDVRATDVTGDGKADLIAALGDDGGVVVLAGHGDGTFDAGQSIAEGSFWRLATLDADNDGDTDVCAPSSTVLVLLNDGAGASRPAKTFRLAVSSGWHQATRPGTVPWT